MIDCDKLRPGLDVKAVSLFSTGGMIIPAEILAARREGALGKVLRYVPGHGGDVWFVNHSDGTTGRTATRSSPRLSQRQ